jgi:hypothetical protein
MNTRWKKGSQHESSIADRWFEFERISNDITLIWEPHAIRLMQCDIWHAGRETPAH